MVFVKVAPFLLSCMSFTQKFSPVISVLTPPSRVSGLALPGESQPLLVISQYVDDTTLVVTSDRTITACFNTYSLFEGPVSIWTSAEVRGLARGKIASITQSTCSGAQHLCWPDCH